MRKERKIGLVLNFMLLLTGVSLAQAPSAEEKARHEATERDHQRMMEIVGVKQLRRGADGYAKGPEGPNYDESQANPTLPLPEVLRLANGEPVKSAEDWWRLRRPQIVELYDREIYGRVPEHLPPVKWELGSVKSEAQNGVAVLTKTLTGHVRNAACPANEVKIDLELTMPAAAKGPVPVVMELGFSREFLEMLRKRAPQFFANEGKEPDWRQQVLARGWGYAEYVPTSVQPDDGAGLTEGMIGLANCGRLRARADEWGALRAWAWGASRALDYMETDPAVDAKHVAIEGHSRYGKATLVAMAYDARFAAAFVSSSGEAGAKLYRRNWGEQVGNIASSGEYHWMAGNFLKYAGPLTVADLPVDNHELIALAAPRPVFISAGTLTAGDGWVDAKGMFLAAVAAGPVYRLLGKKDLGTAEFPAVEHGLMEGALSFRQHAAGHTPAPNWPTFLDFAARSFSHAAK